MCLCVWVCSYKNGWHFARCMGRGTWWFWINITNLLNYTCKANTYRSRSRSSCLTLLTGEHWLWLNIYKRMNGEHFCRNAILLSFRHVAQQQQQQQRRQQPEENLTTTLLDRLFGGWIARVKLRLIVSTFYRKAITMLRFCYSTLAIQRLLAINMKNGIWKKKNTGNKFKIMKLQ